jgi:hypothetical protein
MDLIILTFLCALLFVGSTQICRWSTVDILVLNGIGVGLSRRKPFGDNEFAVRLMDLIILTFLCALLFVGPTQICRWSTVDTLIPPRIAGSLSGFVRACSVACLFLFILAFVHLDTASAFHPYVYPTVPYLVFMMLTLSHLSLLLPSTFIPQHPHDWYYNYHGSSVTYSLCCCCMSKQSLSL